MFMQTTQLNLSRSHTHRDVKIGVRYLEKKVLTGERADLKGAGWGGVGD